MTGNKIIEILNNIFSQEQDIINSILSSNNYINKDNTLDNFLNDINKSSSIKLKFQFQISVLFHFLNSSLIEFSNIKKTLLSMNSQSKIQLENDDNDINNNYNDNSIDITSNQEDFIVQLKEKLLLNCSHQPFIMNASQLANKLKDYFHQVKTTTTATISNLESSNYTLSTLFSDLSYYALFNILLQFNPILNINSIGIRCKLVDQLKLVIKMLFIYLLI